MNSNNAGNKPRPFSYDYYRLMLTRCQEEGYVISSFRDYDASNKRTIIMRHDVDYTLDGVEQFARIEKELGCTATYLLRVHADEYNLFSCVTWRAVMDILEMGHEIGLHFEAMNVGRALNLDPEQLLAREKAVLEAVFGLNVITCSEHREISGLVHGTQLFTDRHNPLDAGFTHYAMDDKYVKEMKYLSDSNATWREGDVLDHVGKHDRFQLLVHCDWWFEKDMLLKGPYYHPRSTHI